MAAKTSLANIKVVAKADANIQGLQDADPLVALVLEQVDRHVPEGVFGTFTEEAQRYLGAHLLSMAFQPEGGRGPLSTESIGGVSQGFTLPWLNQKTVLGGTQFGLHFLEIRNRVVPKFATILTD